MSRASSATTGTRSSPAAGRILEAGNRGAREAGVPSIGLDHRVSPTQVREPLRRLALEFHYFFTR
jgi:hypothetical protein